MSLLTPQQAKITGTVISYAAASAGGDTLRYGEGLELRVNNGSASSVNVTIAVPGNTQFGQPAPDVVVAVPAGGEVAIGPMSEGLVDLATGLISVTYSATASVTVALVRV